MCRVRHHIGTLWTTVIIAVTTNPGPIPDRKIIGRVPAVFAGIVVVRKTIILILSIQRRRGLILTQKESL